MLNWIATAFAAVLIVAGMIVFWLPIPLGLLMMAFGLTILIAANPFVANYVRRLRERHPVWDVRIRAGRSLLPKFFADILKRTDPEPREPVVEREVD